MKTKIIQVMKTCLQVSEFTYNIYCSLVLHQDSSVIFGLSGVYLGL